MKNFMKKNSIPLQIDVRVINPAAIVNTNLANEIDYSLDL